MRKKKKKFRAVVRPKWNVAHFDPIAPIKEKPKIKNLNVQCIKCMHITLVNTETAFKGFNCPLCRNRVRANPKLNNYKFNDKTITDPTSIIMYRIGGYRR